MQKGLPAAQGLPTAMQKGSPAAIVRRHDQTLLQLGFSLPLGRDVSPNDHVQSSRWHFPSRGLAFSRTCLHEGMVPPVA